MTYSDYCFHNFFLSLEVGNSSYLVTCHIICISVYHCHKREGIDAYATIRERY